MRLSDGEIQVTLQLSIPPKDFPQPAKDPNGIRGASAFTLSGAQALRLFDLGRSCVSREETRYYLNGTFLTTKPDAGTLRAVSTAGHRMAIIDCDEPARFIEGPRADGSKATDRPDGLIVPVRAVDLLIAIARKAGNAPLTFHAGPRHLVVTAPGLQLVIQGIDGTYPDYTRGHAAGLRDLHRSPVGQRPEPAAHHRQRHLLRTQPAPAAGSRRGTHVAQHARWRRSEHRPAGARGAGRPDGNL